MIEHGTLLRRSPIVYYEICNEIVFIWKSVLIDTYLLNFLLSPKELEAERVSLMEEVTANKRKMKDLEDNLLYRLTSTQGSLVEDESLIAVLSTTKQTSEEVSEKLTVAAETELKINSAREEYRPGVYLAHC